VSTGPERDYDSLATLAREKARFSMHQGNPVRAQEWIKAAEAAERAGWVHVRGDAELMTEGQWWERLGERVGQAKRDDDFDIDSPIVDRGVEAMVGQHPERGGQERRQAVFNVLRAALRPPS
jgi:hypothetical protein